MADTEDVAALPKPEEKKQEKSILTELPKVIQKSQINDGLVHGLNEVVKALDRKEAQLCLLADDCAEDKYKVLVEAFCHQNNIPLIHVSERNKLGEWLGYFKRDEEGKIRKLRGVSSCALKEFGESTSALEYVLNYAKEEARHN
uniref:40S ribosomal protein S12 n=1 Tax=Euplotes harpa TaxID=151035 RepID=A0A7S3JB14_9SPIT|mmetsp:Transcript_27003/g.31166  ORF Transcript_27003/g.31166 Transcript_27003/m.31166 type:complete len:144 (+) Transcript_27003:41-472(+)|eukprot:CAMPEP_0168340394 /NCGR_PEP_ID=MMETSP0213-20121227/14038_1 /TAXON_ID=151035 /ORGANISM="Euplotes harpa, Strain FSP1.4" /LENGTH=143 /DNA_ID=CAMNT_0008346623 /DNA_START=40 /DNA_END=471 /DNA_ORIENTATION=+